MKIDPIKDGVSFKSGYPTFGMDGHLRSKPNLDIYDLVYLGYKPSGGLQQAGQRLEYFA